MRRRVFTSQPCHKLQWTTGWGYSNWSSKPGSKPLHVTEELLLRLFSQHSSLVVGNKSVFYSLDYSWNLHRLHSSRVPVPEMLMLCHRIWMIFLCSRQGTFAPLYVTFSVTCRELKKKREMILQFLSGLLIRGITIHDWTWNNECRSVGCSSSWPIVMLVRELRNFWTSARGWVIKIHSLFRCCWSPALTKLEFGMWDSRPDDRSYAVIFF